MDLRVLESYYIRGENLKVALVQMKINQNYKYTNYNFGDKIILTVLVAPLNNANPTSQ